MRNLYLFVLGMGLCAGLPELPSLWQLGGLSALCLLVSAVGHRMLRPVCRGLFWLLLGLAYADGRAQLRLAEALPAEWQQKPITFIGVIRDLPSTTAYGKRMQVQVESVLTPGARLPARVLVNAYGRPNETGATPWTTGNRWQFTARFKRPHATANPFGFDGERWMWSAGIGASGNLAKGSVLLGRSTDFMAQVDRWREQVAERVVSVLGEGRSAALVAGLTVGAQSLIAREEWQLLADTGLTHLVSISGLHIGMVAGLLGGVTALLMRWRPTVRVPPRLVVATVTVLAAACYALLAGFSVPTQRTLYMLSCLALMFVWRRVWSAFQMWWLALLVVLLIDPFAVLAPGLWLSFGLVAALIATGMARRGPIGKWRQAAGGQWAATVCSVLPLLLFFGRFPMVSALANLVAIPFVSMLLTPLCLLAVVWPWDGLLHAAGWLSGWFYRGIEPLATWPQLQLPAAPVLLWILAALGSIWLVAPRGMPGRWLGASLWLPLLLYQPDRPAHGTFRATVLDVGQGLSVLVQTANHDLLFDTGAGEASRWVLPQMQGLGVKRLDRLVLSHNHNDHDGAAPGVSAAMQPGLIMAGQQASLDTHELTGVLCQRGQSWQWDGVRFDMLSPAEQAQGKEANAYSCVLRVATRQHAMMLTGDAPARVEQELVERYGAVLRSTVLVAGHHGSRTSTSANWLDTVQPQLAVISAGYLNRYRHPHQQVLKRLATRDVMLLRTDLDGMLTLDMADTVQFDCYRRQQKRWWREAAPCSELSD